MGIFKACKSLNPRKSAGPDFLIINEFFEYGSESNQFVSVISNLFYKLSEPNFFPNNGQKDLLFYYMYIKQWMC